MTASAQEQALGNWLARGLRRMGELAITAANHAYTLTHRDDADRSDHAAYTEPEAAAELARFDDAGNYRPLKTAPTLRHGWKLTVETLEELRVALDHFYPGRLAAHFVAEQEQLKTTPLRATLERQTGMYRIAAQITDAQANELVGNFCRSDGGCLRTILWRRDVAGTIPSSKLRPEKFDAAYDQTGRREAVIPLLCQEACSLLVAEARNVVQSSR
ncbi:MAG: DR2241 family protein [Chthoniobacterales bacterium]